MGIVTVRRVSQVFFFAWFLWFCLVSSLGEHYWQLRGWPVNWFLQLDPLAALGSLLASGSLYAGMAWALLTIALTAVLGRFFCSWVCPFGAMHHFLGWLAGWRLGARQRVERNRPHAAQAIKYYLLLGLLAAAGGQVLHHLAKLPLGLGSVSGWLLLLAILAACAALGVRRLWPQPRQALLAGLGLLALMVGLSLWASPGEIIGATLQTGLLDPIPLAQRSINLLLLPALDAASGQLWVAARHYQGAWLIALVFMAALLLNFIVPRFYCRFICPLGALMGLLGHWALWRVGRREAKCRGCQLCEVSCEGACEPFHHLRASECVLCMNCLDTCRDSQMTYATRRSAAGEQPLPDLSRRGVVLSLVSGVAAVPALRLGGVLGPNWSPALVRPPGALAEAQFVERCLKCGQCMRVCPTNVLQPAGLELGLEALWTPTLNMRIGTSGCQLNCVACGQICPTAAIRPITLDEKRGLGAFAKAGPLRLGTAFVDRGRCLPWAMDRPCIVCQENCPVSPKAIITREVYGVLARARVKAQEGQTVRLTGADLPPGRLGTGDYFLQAAGGGPTNRQRISGNGADHVKLPPGEGWQPSPGQEVELVVRLQQPQVDASRCIGCGVCEHECPVSGLRAIRITAENESRSAKRSLLL
ncbi:MAG: 4Fe-4S binding protein [Desulfarculus sp.]|nr:4Fe-4S binding protein [Desulfarculus sp.]